MWTSKGRWHSQRKANGTPDRKSSTPPVEAGERCTISISCTLTDWLDSTCGGVCFHVHSAHNHACTHHVHNQCCEQNGETEHPWCLNVISLTCDVSCCVTWFTPLCSLLSTTVGFILRFCLLLLIHNCQVHCDFFRFRKKSSFQPFTDLLLVSVTSFSSFCQTSYIHSQAFVCCVLPVLSTRSKWSLLNAVTKSGQWWSFVFIYTSSQEHADSFQCVAQLRVQE